MQNSFQANRKLRTVLANGIIMGLYIVLSLLVRPVSSGMIQFRISESLNHLVVFNRKLMWGVLGGVIFFNLFFGFGVMDALFGGAQTLFALSLTAFLQKKVPSIPVRMCLNSLFFTVSMFFIAFMLVPSGGQAFWTTYGWLALSEAIIMTISAPIIYFINKSLKFETRI